MSFLVDTNVLSELTKRRPNPGALTWLSSQKTLTISAITVDELSFGVLRAPVGRRAQLVAWLEALLAARPTIVAIDEHVARLAGELRAAAADRGQPVTQPDMLLAASALLGRHTLATRNLRDFRGCGVRLLDPFS
jgi:predicted nucleic acid-binding protein